MKSRLPPSCLGVVSGAMLALATPGCQTDSSSEFYNAEPAGSISDVNRKLGVQNEAPTAPSAGKDKAQILLLVMHDAEGKPLYVETQRSSGDPALDRRAQDFVLRERRFPKGAANTVFVTLDPKSVPKP